MATCDPDLSIHCDDVPIVKRWIHTHNATVETDKIILTTCAVVNCSYKTSVNQTSNDASHCVSIPWSWPCAAVASVACLFLYNRTSLLHRCVFFHRDDVAGLEKAKQILDEATIWPMLKPAWFKGLQPVSVCTISVLCTACTWNTLTILSCQSLTVAAHKPLHIARLLITWICAPLRHFSVFMCCSRAVATSFQLYVNVTNF